MPQVVHTAGNQKIVLLTAMLKSADDRGRVRASLGDLGHETTLDMHDVTKTAWALQKQGLLKFRETKRTTTGGGVSVLSDFQLMQIERVRQVVANGTLVGRPVKVRAAPISTDPGVIVTMIERKPRSFAVPTEDELNAEVPVLLRVYRKDFPVLAKVLARGHNVRAAANLLSEEGLDDLALQVLDQITYSPLETEMLDLVKLGVIIFVEDQP